MTPDTINYIIGYIVLKMYQGKKIDILDTTIGTGNMINSIVNLEGVDADRILGIENNEKLARLALANSKLQDNEITIYLQDVLNDIHDTVDVVVGDLESYNHEVGINNINYFPYVTILNRLKNIKDDGLFIYLIDNDFFQKDEAMAFKTIFDNHATLLGLIVLPKTAFAFNHIGKSIIIGKKTLYQNYDMTVQRLPSFHNEDELSSFLKHLSEWIKQIK